MRVDCTGCSAQYTISDDRLERGPVRMKCRQCRTLLIVESDGKAHAADDDFGQPLEPGSSVADPPSDAYATVPLPSLEELGLDPNVLAGASRLGIANPPNPGAVRALVDLDGDDDFGQPLPRSPKSPGYELGRSTQTTDPPSRRPASQSPSPGARRITISVPVPPVTQLGWGVLVGLGVCGLLLGTALAQHEERLPFDEPAARRAMHVATVAAVACFEKHSPHLQGVIEVSLDPASGEVSELLSRGGVTMSDQLGCIEKQFRGIELPPFSGPPVRLRQTLSASRASRSE